MLLPLATTSGAPSGKMGFMEGDRSLGCRIESVQGVKFKDLACSDVYVSGDRHEG